MADAPIPMLRLLAQYPSTLKAPQEALWYLDCVDAATVWEDMAGDGLRIMLERGGYLVGWVKIGGNDA